MSTPPKRKRGLRGTALRTTGDSQSRAVANKTRSSAEAGSQNGHSYQPLRTEFRHDGFNYRQIAREEDVAIYEQTWAKGSSRAIRYEVIRIRRRDGFVIHGRHVEPAEVYPPSESWGTNGFTATEKDRAFAKLKQLLEQKESPTSGTEAGAGHAIGIGEI